MDKYIYNLSNNYNIASLALFMIKDFANLCVFAAGRLNFLCFLSAYVLVRGLGRSPWALLDESLDFS